MNPADACGQAAHRHDRRAPSGCRAAAVHIYEMEYLEDGRYVCNEFIGEGLESLLGPILTGRRGAGLGRRCSSRRQGRLPGLQRGPPPGPADGARVPAAGVRRRHPLGVGRARPRFTMGGCWWKASSPTSPTVTRPASCRRGPAAHLAYHDALTDLPNRLKFSEQLERDRRGGAAPARGRGAVRGHGRFQARQRQPRTRRRRRSAAVWPRLRQAVRAKDIVARLGGDEFLVLLPMPGRRSQHRPTRSPRRSASALVSRPAERSTWSCSSPPASGSRSTRSMQAPKTSS